MNRIVLFLFFFVSIQLSFKKDTAGDNFQDKFIRIKAEEIPDNVFKAIGNDWTCITAGNDSLYNSMTASFGGWGILFGKPVTWCILRANRYTLEIIRKHKKYTMSYFDNEYKDQLLLFGSKSGRNSNKMKETTLTKIVTPDGNISFKEARLIIECELLQITTVKPDDFLTSEAKKFIVEGYNDAGDYHKLVFGEISSVWIKK